MQSSVGSTRQVASPSLDAAKNLASESAEMFEAAMRAARLLTNRRMDNTGSANGAEDIPSAAFLTGGAGQQAGITTDSSNKIASDLMPIADDKSLMTALEMFVKLSGEGGILDLTNTTFDDDKQKELMAYFKEIGISPEDGQRLLDLINNLKLAGAESIAVLEVTDEETNETTLMTDEEKRENVDILAQMADLLYPQMGQTEFEAQLELIKVTPEPAIISNRNVAMLLVPQFEEDGASQYFTPTDLMNALYTIDGLSPEQLSAFQSELEGGELSFGEVIKTIIGEDITAETDTSANLANTLTTTETAQTAETSPKTQAAAALTNMIAEFKRTNSENKTEQSPREYEMTFTSQTFRTRIVRSPEMNESGYDESGEADENSENTEPQMPFADSLNKPETTETAQAPQTNTQPQNSAVPPINTQAVNFQQNNIPINAARADAMNTPIFDPPEVQLASRIMSMDLSASDVQEMTVVLNPEALGEVAVKVTNEGGAVTVAMTAANPATQKILGDTAAALLQTLKQGGADVREVLVIAAADAGAEMGLNLGAGGFTRQSGEGNSAERSGSGRVSGIGNTADTDEIAEAAETDYESRGARLWQTA
jgi:flagellar hook-length control protein FliK